MLNKDLNNQFYSNWLCKKCAQATFLFQCLSDSEFNSVNSYNTNKSKLPSSAYLMIYLQLMKTVNIDSEDNNIVPQDYYIDIKEANNIYITEIQKLFINLHVWSLLNPANFTKFQSFVVASNFQPDIIAINET